MFSKNTISRFLSLTVVLFCGGFFLVSTETAEAYTYTATAVSPVRTYASPLAFGTIVWTEVASSTGTTPRPANSAITVEVRAGDVVTPDATWTNGGIYTPVTSGQSLSTLGVHQYFEYRIVFDYDDLSDMPGVSDVTVTTYSGELISSVYDTRNFGNSIQSIAWTESIAGQANVLIQMRTSYNGTSWTNWCGPDNATTGCDSTTYFTDPTGGQTIDADFQDRGLASNTSSDRYVQYKFLLFSDAVNTPVISDVTVGYDRIASSVSAVSPVLDPQGQAVAFGTITWTETLPVETSVTVDVNAGNTPTPDGSWTGYTIGVTNGQDISALFPSYRYIQYRINMSTYDPDNIASVSDVTLSYSYFPIGAFPIIGSPYNTESPANLLAELRWTETTPTNTNVKFQMRTAPDVAGAPDWTLGSGWCGPTNCAVTTGDSDYSSDFYETTQAGETANTIHTTGDNDQWIQYIAWIETATAFDTPTLSDVTLRYVVNARPEFDTTYDTNGITVTQIGDDTDPDWGKVKIIYRVRDVDTTDGTNTPGYITPSFSYDNGAGFVTIGSGNLSASAITNKTVDAVPTPSTQSIGMPNSTS